MSKIFIAVIIAATTMLPVVSGKNPQPLELCTLAANWQQFSGKTIRIRALFQEGAEQSTLSDPTCRNGEPLVFVSPRARVDGKKRQLRRILDKNRQADVVLEGVFRGPEPAAIDPKLPEWMKEKLKDSKQRYGHLASFDMMIEVTKIIQVKNVAAGMKPGHP